MKSVIGMAILVAMTFTASASFADGSSGTVSGLHIHQKFSMVDIQGETAEKIYERMQVPEKEEVNGSGRHSYTKVSVDRRMACEKISVGVVGADFYIPEKQVTFKCSFTFDTTSGAINQTYFK